MTVTCSQAAELDAPDGSWATKTAWSLGSRTGSNIVPNLKLLIKKDYLKCALATVRYEPAGPFAENHILNLAGGVVSLHHYRSSGQVDMEVLLELCQCVAQKFHHGRRILWHAMLSSSHHKEMAVTQKASHVGPGADHSTEGFGSEGF